ncbi:MAG: hypothetical protein M1812_002470 [Candelaria pacifica]|nr:MAG: hypothetical protein M1812_002470 [Candelaria pacifica]
MVNKISKKQKLSPVIPNKHLHSRLSYLFQAAQYLSAQSILAQRCVEAKEQPVGQPQGIETFRPDDDCGLQSENTERLPPTGDNRAPSTSREEPRTKSTQNVVLLARAPHSLSSQLLSHLRAISLKSQIRLSGSVKRSICKCCSALLVPGQTACYQIDNSSRGSRKPWADVLVIQCNVCGTGKRYPVGATKQDRRCEEGQVKQPGETADTSQL